MDRWIECAQKCSRISCGAAGQKEERGERREEEEEDLRAEMIYYFTRHNDLSWTM